MIKTLKKNHYLATQPSVYPSSHQDYANSTDGEESQRADSERTMSEYTVMNERSHQQQLRPAPLGQTHTSRSSHRDDSSSDIYVTSAAYRPPSEVSMSMSRHEASQYRAPSEVSRSTIKVDRKRGVVVETMSAPNPFCPHTRGMCCLMILLNLGLALVTLGIVIVVQFFQPLFVWILGLVFLIFGFLTLVGSLIYCITICRDAKTPAQIAAEDHHWTRYWSKGFGSHSEIHYKSDDKYSDRY